MVHNQDLFESLFYILNGKLQDKIECEGMLSISTSEQVLRRLFAGQNQ